jgi:hypothetical protein
VPENEAAQRRVPKPGDPGVAIVIAANEALTDPTVRDSCRQMLTDGYPLVKMVEALGLEDDLTEPIRRIVEGLGGDAVAGIRRAVLEMLDRTNYALPLDCNVTEAELEAGIAVDVEVIREHEVETIHVRPAITETK